MIIHTKFSIGDKVFYIKNACILCDTISCILYRKYTNDEILEYKVKSEDEFYTDENLFVTKEELVQHLLEESSL